MLNSIRVTTVIVLALAIPQLAYAQTASEYNVQGFEYYNAGQWSDAIVSFEAAYNLAPENETIRRNLSNAYQALGDTQAREKQMKAAIESVIQALELDTTNPLPLVQLGSYYVREGRVNEAIMRLEEAIELDPYMVDAHFLLGEAYYKDNDATSALDQWEWVQKVEPNRSGLQERMDGAYRQERVEFEFKGLESTHFSITYNRNLRWANAKSVLQILEATYREIGIDFGRAYPPAPIQVTLYSPEEFSETTQMGEHVGALYDGVKIRVSVLDAQGKHIDNEELRRKLRHEYVHVVVRHLAKDNVPWWLNEGLAETLSRDLDPADFDYLRRASQEGLLFSLQELSPGQLNRLEVDALKLAYQQSHATVAYLKKKFGLAKLSNLLRDMGSGTLPETALSSACYLNFTTLQKAVNAFIERG